MKKLLVTGASGFLGSRIAAFYKENYLVLAPRHAQLDITDEKSVFHYFKQCKPDIVIHCAAISDTGTCEKNPNLSFSVNVTGSENITKASLLFGAKCILCSSDQVYCNSTYEHANFETDIVTPYNIYGMHKLAAEQSCLDLNTDSVHLRLAWMYDSKIDMNAPRNDFAKQLLRSISEKSDLALPINDKRGIADVWEVVRNIEKTFDLPGGVYNFGSPNDKSTYETAVSVLTALNCDTSYLKEKVYDAARNLSMSQKKLESYDIHFSTTKDALIQCLKNYV